MEVMRVFVGGLPRHIETDELRKRFTKYGKVLDVEVKNKADATGEWLKTFGYLNLETTMQEFQKCKGQLNNSTWRDGKISIQLAKQDTAVKYAEERKAREDLGKGETKIQDTSTSIPTELKGAVPGTTLPEHENWVVTKFQRVVPIMNVRSKDKKNVFLYDPSKRSHQIKKLDVENKKGKIEEHKGQDVSELTWSLNSSREAHSADKEGVEYRKRVGDFSGLTKSAKKKKTRGAEEVLQQEKERRAQAILNDDMEVVSVNQPVSHTADSLSNDTKTMQAAYNNQGVDLSRFDSDSDDEVIPAPKSVTNGKPNYKKQSDSSCALKPKGVNSTKMAPKSGDKPNNTSRRKPFGGTAAALRYNSTVVSETSKRKVSERSSSSESSSEDESLKQNNKSLIGKKKPVESNSDSSSSEEEIRQTQKPTKKLSLQKRKKSSSSSSSSTSSEEETQKSRNSKTQSNKQMVTKSPPSKSDDRTDSDSDSGVNIPMKKSTTKDTKLMKDHQKSSNTTNEDVKDNLSTNNLNPSVVNTPSSALASNDLASLLQNAAKSMETGNMTQQFAVLLEAAAKIIKSAGNTTTTAAQDEPGAAKIVGNDLQPKSLDFSGADGSDSDTRKGSRSCRKSLTAPSVIARSTTSVRKAEVTESSSDSDPQEPTKTVPKRKAGTVSKISTKLPIKGSSSSSDSEEEKKQPKISQITHQKSSSSETSSDSDGADKPTTKSSSSKVTVTKIKRQQSSSSSESSSDSDNGPQTPNITASRNMPPPHNTKQTASSSSSSSDDEIVNNMPAPVQSNELSKNKLAKLAKDKKADKSSSDSSSSDSSPDSDEEAASLQKKVSSSLKQPAKNSSDNTRSLAGKSRFDSSSSDSSGVSNDDKPSSKSRATKEIKDNSSELQDKFKTSSSSSDSSDSDDVKPAKSRQASENTKKSTSNVTDNDGKGKKTLTVGEKRALANQKRLDALSNKSKEMSSQQKAIQESLSNLDKPSGNNKIVFDSDSDNEAPTSLAKTSADIAPTTKQQKTLFDGSSDESEDESAADYDKMFAIKPQFEGEKGAKLLNMQQRFNDDSRFKLTEKFLESDSSDEEGERQKETIEKTTSEVNEEVDGATERRRNLQILQSIVGTKNVKIDHPTASQTKSRKLADTPNTVFRDISSMQFDPTSDAQENLIKKVAPSEPKPKKKKKKLEGSEPVAGSEPAPEVTKDRFFEVAVDFGKAEEATATSVKAKTGKVEKAGSGSGGGGMLFNFLGDEAEDEEVQSEASSDEEDDDEDMDTTESQTEKEKVVDTKYKNPFDPSNGGLRFDDESDDDEDKAVDGGATTGARVTKETDSTPKHVTIAPNTVVDWFFFKPEDPRLVDGAKRFCRTMNDAQVKKKWEQIRPKLVENYLMKSKRATHKLKVHRTTITKKRFGAKPQRGGKPRRF